MIQKGYSDCSTVTAGLTIIIIIIVVTMLMTMSLRQTRCRRLWPRRGWRKLVWKQAQGGRYHHFDPNATLRWSRPGSRLWTLSSQKCPAVAGCRGVRPQSDHHQDPYLTFVTSTTCGEKSVREWPGKSQLQWFPVGCQGARLQNPWEERPHWAGPRPCPYHHQHHQNDYCRHRCHPQPHHHHHHHQYDKYDQGATKTGTGPGSDEELGATWGGNTHRLSTLERDCHQGPSGWSSWWRWGWAWWWWWGGGGEGGWWGWWQSCKRMMMEPLRLWWRSLLKDDDMVMDYSYSSPLSHLCPTHHPQTTTISNFPRNELEFTFYRLESSNYQILATFPRSWEARFVSMLSLPMYCWNISCYFLLALTCC